MRSTDISAASKLLAILLQLTWAVSTAIAIETAPLPRRVKERMLDQAFGRPDNYEQPKYPMP